MGEENKMMEGICLGIIGSRNYENKIEFEQHVRAWIKKNGHPAIIVSGGAEGADALAASFATTNKIPLDEIHADWTTYGKNAGPVRNTQIATLCTHILAFPSHFGKGTQDAIKKAKARGKNVTVHYIDEPEQLKKPSENKV